MTCFKGCAVVLLSCTCFAVAGGVLMNWFYEMWPGHYRDLFVRGCDGPDPVGLGSEHGFLQGLLVGVAAVVILRRIYPPKARDPDGQRATQERSRGAATQSLFDSLPDWLSRTERISRPTCQSDSGRASPGASAAESPTQGITLKRLTPE